MDNDRLQNLKNQAISSILETTNEKELEELRIEYLGRHGQITQLIKKIPLLPLEQKKDKGRLVNETRKIIEEAIISQKKTFQHQTLSGQENWFDITLPGKKPTKGHLHLITSAIEEITDIFKRLGFYRVAYPEVEWDWYAFEGLNMPKNHPARDEWETFFIENLKHPKYGEAVLTPHTSSGQLREMRRLGKPPIRMLNIAKCYRRQIDASHAPMFYQFEGLVVDQGINITHLKETLDFFVKQYFGPQRKVRIRPFHFQFTEPSFEVDISCLVCGGQGCKVCKQGWVELGGAGMVHPTVLKNGGFNPSKYTGFAFGWGVERVLMMKYKIDDIRLLFNGNLKFLKQF